MEMLVKYKRVILKQMDHLTRAQNANLPNPEQIARNLNTPLNRRRLINEIKFVKEFKKFFCS
jgi:hypothetical protein